MCDLSNPQAGYKVRDYYMSGELQGEGYCTYLGIKDDADTKWDGKVVTYHKNGKIASERNHTNGMLNGDFITYYENGLIETKIPFINDYIDGVALVFTNDGAKCKKVEYSNGKYVNDYYEIIDNNGFYSKFYLSNDKIKWVSPSVAEQKTAYSNGKAIHYYENNGLTVSIFMAPTVDYGKYYKFNVVVENRSCEPINVKLSDIKATFNYTVGAKTKVDKVRLHILPYFEYETKVRKRQNAVKALNAFVNSMNAAKAGYSASSTTVNSGYAGASATVGGAAAIGSGGWAVGVGAKGSAYIGASSTDINTVSYDGLAAYQANMIANAQYQAMSEEMLEERAAKIDDYLKEDTVFPGDIIDGYFLIPYKIKKANKVGGDLCVNFKISDATYDFSYHFMSSQEMTNQILDIQQKVKDKEISRKEGLNKVEELYKTQPGSPKIKNLTKVSLGFYL